MSHSGVIGGVTKVNNNNIIGCQLRNLRAQLLCPTYDLVRKNQTLTNNNTKVPY